MQIVLCWLYNLRIIFDYQAAYLSVYFAICLIILLLFLYHCIHDVFCVDCCEHFGIHLIYLDLSLLMHFVCVFLCCSVDNLRIIIYSIACYNLLLCLYNLWSIYYIWTYYCIIAFLFILCWSSLTLCYSINIFEFLLLIAFSVFFYC